MSSKAVLAVVVLGTLSLCEGLLAGCDQQTPVVAGDPGDGKRVLALSKLKNVQIEMPDQTTKNFGEDFQSSLTTRLTQSGEFIVVAPDPLAGVPKAGAMSELQAPAEPDGPEWADASTTPAATISIQVDALTFETGLKGEHSFYGFDERFSTPFNDGTGAFANEFPLRTVAFEPTWFDRTFDDRGTAPFDSQSGLDLGDGFDVNVLFAWLQVKYAHYLTDLHFRVVVDAPLLGINEYHVVKVSGEGYYYDVAGAYEGYSAAIRIARTDAMARAVANGLAAASDLAMSKFTSFPLVAKIDHILPDGSIYLGTGPKAGVKPGVLYSPLDNPGVAVQVDLSTDSGAIAHLAAGSLSQVFEGSIVRQIQSLPTPKLAPAPAASAVPTVAPAALALSAGASPTIMALEDPVEAPPASVNSVTMPWTNLPKADLKGTGPSDSNALAIAKSVLGTPFLPYRILRYNEYDRDYKSKADGSGSPAQWAKDQLGEAWAKQTGLDQAPPMSSNSIPIVAVIDSGVDYNHPALHDAIWINPQPWTDPSARQDGYGWDFVSNDSRPYDDGYHGTEVASLVISVAPKARIMPLKIFSPYGITSSASVYAAVRYAVDHGAQLVVCAWATRLPSASIEMGVAYAKEHGVPVVAASGDRGDDLNAVGSYPAVLSAHYDNVVTVTGVDSGDKLVQVSGSYANFDRHTVMIAAPGQNIRVADPRNDNSRRTSTSLAAGIVAGALARIIAQTPQSPYADWIRTLQTQATPVPGLVDGVTGGLRVHFGP